MNDIIVIGDDIAEIDEPRRRMSKEFETKDLGRLKYFLGIKVVYSRNRVFILQTKVHP